MTSKGSTSVTDGSVYLTISKRQAAMALRAQVTKVAVSASSRPSGVSTKRRTTQKPEKAPAMATRKRRKKLSCREEWEGKDKRKLTRRTLGRQTLQKKGERGVCSIGLVLPSPETSESAESTDHQGRDLD